MEFSEILGFFKILSESTKLLTKNGKFMAPITLLSLILPSILLLLFSYFYQFMTNYKTNYITNSSEADSKFFLRLISYLVPLLAVEFAVMFLYIVISRLSGIATVLISAMSYTEKKISLQNLIQKTKTTWKSQRSKTFRTKQNNPTVIVGFIGLMIVTPLAIFHPNPINIAFSIALWISIFAVGIYSSVVTELTAVISIVEEVEVAEAVERGEKLVEGQRQYGIMMNLFFNFVCLIVLAAGWILMMGDGGVLNVTEYGLLCVNLLSVGKIFVAAMYTVFYFQCRKFHGEDVDVFGSLEYSKLPADANVGKDIA